MWQKAGRVWHLTGNYLTEDASALRDVGKRGPRSSQPAFLELSGQERLGWVSHKNTCAQISSSAGIWSHVSPLFPGKGWVFIINVQPRLVDLLQASVARKVKAGWRFCGELL